MSNYTFYFDESMHDRKIGLSKDGDFNFMKESSFDVYVGAFWGIRTKKLSQVNMLLTAFENKQKQTFGLTAAQELKTTTLNKKNFNYGFRSFNRDCHCFYNDLFDLIHSINPVIQITMISKMELFLRHVFSNYVFELTCINENSFYYSIAKFMIVYGTEELRNELISVRCIEDMNHFIESIISELKTIKRKNQSIPRKRRENEAFEQLILILENTETASGVSQKQYPFEYRFVFDGLCRLLEEKRINTKTTEVIIDNEEKTYIAAQSFAFEKTKKLESYQSVELRMADWIVGFAGRMVVALNRDKSLNEHIESLSELDEKDMVSKHLLSSEWFEISEESFELYKKAYQVFILDRLNEYWASMTAAYSDATTLFYSLLRYFGGFDDYSDYIRIPVNEHPDSFNSLACQDLSRVYRQLSNCL